MIPSQWPPSLSTMAIEAKPDAPVLVVDDDPKILGLVRTYLQREGLGVVTAGDGSVALDEIRRSRPQLVVLDLMLPGLDGMSVLRQLRQESDVPVLVLTGGADRARQGDPATDEAEPRRGRDPSSRRPHHRPRPPSGVAGRPGGQPDLY